MRRKTEFERILEAESEIQKLASSVNASEYIKSLAEEALRATEVTHAVRQLERQSAEILSTDNLLEHVSEVERIHSAASDLAKAAEQFPEFPRINELVEISVDPVSQLYEAAIQEVEKIMSAKGLANALQSTAMNDALDLEKSMRVFFDLPYHPVTAFKEAIEHCDPNASYKSREVINWVSSHERTENATGDLTEISIGSPEAFADVLIITGLGEELTAFRKIFDVSETARSSAFRVQYFFGSVGSKNRCYRVALAKGYDMGNLHSAQITSAAIQDLNPKLILSAGIGYTLNPKKLQLCDIHVSNEIIHWGLTSKEYATGSKRQRSVLIAAGSYEIRQEVDHYISGMKTGLMSYEDFKAQCTIKQPACNKKNVLKILAEIDKEISCGVPDRFYNETPRIVVGQTIVSDDVVVASLEGIRNRSARVAGSESHISGEMEAAGIGMAISYSRKNIDFLAIRGICDFGYGKESLEGASRQFRKIAAARTAMFIKGFLQCDPSISLHNGSAPEPFGKPLDK